MAKGTALDVTFRDNWQKVSSAKRGILLQPLITTDDDIYDNASYWLDQLNQLKGEWHNGLPLIIDMFGEGIQLNIDLANILGLYIFQNYNCEVLPLLRINIGVWSEWLKGNEQETLKLLRYYNILLAQPQVTKPSQLTKVPPITWWEYQWGRYGFDESSLWNDTFTPQPPPPSEPPNEHETIMEQLARMENEIMDLAKTNKELENKMSVVTSIVKLEISTERVYELSLFGGLIKGKIYLA